MKLGYASGLAVSSDPRSVREVPAPPGLMRQAGEFAAAAAGWSGMQAGAIPLCPGEFRFKSGSPGVQALAKSRGYYFPLMKGPTRFVILLLSSCLSLASKWQSWLDFSVMLSVHLKPSMFPEGSWRQLLPLMAGTVTLRGRSVWLWLKSTDILHGVCVYCYTCAGELPQSDSPSRS